MMETTKSKNSDENNDADGGYLRSKENTLMIIDDDYADYGN